MILLTVLVAGIKDGPKKGLQIDFALYPNTKIMVQNMSSARSYWESLRSELQPHNIELIDSKGSNITEG